MENDLSRLQVSITGAVQGVGFRPFVYRLAQELGLKGWVSNSTQGAILEIEGSSTELHLFLNRLEKEKPSHALLQRIESKSLDPIGHTQFEIRPSLHSEKTTWILPDIATCTECLSEILDPKNRRYLYPFTNCTHCGPRHSILLSLPYDRANTTMKNFKMCDLCQKEYEDPKNRRFHAQPNACPNCGPHLELWNSQGEVLAKHHEALLQTTQRLREGRIVAIKGIGGFHLMVDARNESAVQMLRNRKGREEKPFALIAPSLGWIKEESEVSALEENLLQSPASPIVLLRRKENDFSSIAANVAPRNPYLGVMLPYSPLHHLLLQELQFPIIATSGNLSEEPICTDEKEALKRLYPIADFFLIHNRSIARSIDDSVTCKMAERELILRRGRGYAPLPILMKEKLPPILAVGGHLKNTIALSVDSQIFVSQHIGDLQTPEAYRSFQSTISDFQTIYEVQPERIACDLHPDYLSTQFAKKINLPRTHVQHHVAHLLACMAENDLLSANGCEEVLGIAWDGSGYGEDETVWGGEFFKMQGKQIQRIAHFRHFPLLGNEQAIREGKRVALALFYESLGESLWVKRKNPESFLGKFLNRFSEEKIKIFSSLLKKKTGPLLTSSVGRLFDAVAALSGIRDQSNFEGQAAMELEFASRRNPVQENYPFGILEHENSCLTIDWEPFIRNLIADLEEGTMVHTVSEKFHNTLIEIILAMAKRFKIPKVVLSGGCFQNRYLTERTIQRLREENFHPYWHQKIPPNDGGISVGQVIACALQFQEKS